MAERSADWMAQAASDLRHARADIDAGFFDWACFSAQQAAEKAVKAVFARLGAEAWGHSVSELLGEVANTHPMPAEVIQAALELDKAYIPTRYPDAHPSGSPSSRYTVTEAERMAAHAERIVGLCQGLLSQNEP